MTDNRKKANELLATAAKIVTTDRGNQHGGAEDSFDMIASFWTTWLVNTNKHRHGIDVGNLVIRREDVAQMMSLLKKARSVHGSHQDDHYIDDAGYTALGGMMMDPVPVDGVDAIREMNDALRQTPLVDNALLDQKVAAARIKQGADEQFRGAGQGKPPLGGLTSAMRRVEETERQEVK